MGYQQAGMGFAMSSFRLICGCGRDMKCKVRMHRLFKVQYKATAKCPQCNNKVRAKGKTRSEAIDNMHYTAAVLFAYRFGKPALMVIEGKDNQVS